ncbi:hypothetical protein Fcan01_27709 [Folsomia candida]|uniref:Uncharacterized protein n=1 Tax=Folsomia candida TaxID=158441 RepID=A0A226CYH3_FOLCA|nr:hypothetical protein Fcan01_27709 [Folsomia candida]
MFFDNSVYPWCRFVSKSWHVGATHALKLRTQIGIEFHPENSTDHDVVAEKLKFCPVNIDIKFSYKYSQREYVEPSFDPKTFDPVRKMKSISIQFLTPHHVQWQKDSVLRLIRMSPTSLQRLQFKWENYHVFPSLCGKSFSKLKRLEISYPAQLRNESLERIGHAVTEAFTAIEQIQIETRHLLELGKAGFLKNFPGSLNTLELFGGLDNNNMECLLEIPGPLKKLAFYAIKLDHNDDLISEIPTIMYTLLKKHSLSLENLCIDILPHTQLG